MRRKVQCVDSANQEQVDEQYCLDPKPMEEIKCYASSGCVTPSTYNWRTSRWTEVSLLLNEKEKCHKKYIHLYYFDQTKV